MGRGSGMKLRRGDGLSLALFVLVAAVPIAASAFAIIWFGVLDS